MTTQTECDFEAFLLPSDVLLVVPPFAKIIWPSLGVHLLQACARRLGFEVSVCYSNILFASIIGLDEYDGICDSPNHLLLGERIFASAAFDLPQLGLRAEKLKGNSWLSSPEDIDEKIANLCKITTEANNFCEKLSIAIAKKGYSVVGCTTTFQQTVPALGILAGIKRHAPRVLTILGGANCEGEMAQGLSGITNMVDFIFSGESEESFCDFIKSVKENKPLSSKIIVGKPCTDLSSLPCPDYADYFRQLNAALPEIELAQTWIVYETSRGCWWGEKSHCTFCGLNGTQLTYRRKDPETVLGHMETLMELYPTKKICMADNIMPFEYNQTLIPQINRLKIRPYIFYEQKANLSLQQVHALSLAGVMVMQPGIESLSTRILVLIGKGLTARQNISLLRYTRICGVEVKWNLLYALPGDYAQDYREILALVPSITHLPPPAGVCSLRIDRFSPYFNYAERFGIQEISPLPAYSDVFPDKSDIFKIAYHFEANYESESAKDVELYKQLSLTVSEWRGLWNKPEVSPPMLALTPLDTDHYLLIDTRPHRGNGKVMVLNLNQAAATLYGGKANNCLFGKWAVENHFALLLDDYYVPLATTDKDTMDEVGRLLHV